MDAPTYRETTDVLAAMREAPDRRVLIDIGDDTCVIHEPPGGLHLLSDPVLAYVEAGEDSPISSLLLSAALADTAGDLAAWQREPLRYRRLDQTWVLPDHPLAPAQPWSHSRLALPTISTAEDLLALLTASPTQRAVAWVEGDDSMRSEPAVCECVADTTSPAHIIAYIDQRSPAYELLTHHREFTPLRHVADNVTWVLPEHPLANRPPGTPYDIAEDIPF